MSISILNVTIMTAMNSAVRIDYLKDDVQRVKFFAPTFSEVTMNEYIDSITCEGVVAPKAKAEKKAPVAQVQPAAPVSQAVVQAVPVQPAAPVSQDVVQAAPVQPAAPVSQAVVQAAPVQQAPVVQAPPPPAPVVQAPPPPAPVVQAPPPALPPQAGTPVQVPLILALNGQPLNRVAPAKVPAQGTDATIVELFSQVGKVDEATAREEAGEVCAQGEPIAALSARVARWPETNPPEIPGYMFLRVKDGKLPAETEADKLVRSVVLQWIQEAIGTHKDARLTADAIAIFHKVNMLVATSGYPVLVNGVPSTETKGWYIHTLQTYMSQWADYVRQGMEQGVLATQAPKNLFEQVNPDHTVKYPANAAPFDGWMQGRLPA